MQFGEIIGHQEEIRKLTQMVDGGRVPHALLLHGPSGIGKTKVARAFVQYLYCTDRRGGDSCGRCPACLQTAKMNNPDVHFVYPIVKKKPTTVCADFADEWKEFVEKVPYMSPERWMDFIDAGNSRPIIYASESEEMLRISSLSAYGDGRKVFVVWQPEKMNPEAANRLLKVIEEPFEDTLFLFISNNPGEILPTIRSRLQDVRFRPPGESDLINYICVEGSSSYEEAISIARIARGDLNKASAIVKESGEIREFISDFIGVMRAAYARKMVELKGFSDKFAGYGREKSMRLLDYMSRMVRESFISNLRCGRLEAMLPEEKKFVERFGPFINAANVEEMAREIDRAREDISRNANQKIVWFDLLIELTRLIRTKGMGK